MGQGTPLSGVINVYAAVTNIAGATCQAIVTVDNATGFHARDTVMVMQMKGAVIDTTNTSHFGNITNLNGAGQYEFHTVASVSGQDIYLTSLLAAHFDVNGKVELIRIPSYGSATVGGTLTCSKWNGSTGGVLCFFVQGTLTLNDYIDVSGKGFRGGDVSNNPDGACGNGSPDYYYPLTQANTSYWDYGAAKKGEGISELPAAQLAGRGPLANGGGGGNKHNHGGGGGSNYTAGGLGGEVLVGCPIDGFMGIGGRSLSNYTTTQRLYLGGGGGSGDFNNAAGSYGADGGGIVIIKAASIVGAGFTINAKGNDELVVGGAALDGVGGGGAGGSIYLDAPAISALTLDVSGGQGGDQGFNCVGTGGGGGVGPILLTTATLPASVSIAAHPGRAGIFVTGGCTQGGPHYYATAGDSTTGILQVGVPGVGLTSVAAAADSRKDTTICSGDTLTLAGRAHFGSYLWQDGSTNSVLRVYSNGTYWVRSVSGSCTVTDTIVVTIAPTPVIHLGPDQTICSYASAHLDASVPGGTYAWSDGYTLPARDVSTAGRYSVTVSAGGCSAADTIAISVVTIPTSALGQDMGLCDGDTYLLDPHVSDPLVTYTWQDGSHGATYAVTAAGSYSLTLSEQNCARADTISISYHPRPVVALGADTILCEMQPLLLDVTNAGAIYSWSDGADTPVRTISASGVYSVTVDVSGCRVSDTIAVSYIPLPVALLWQDSSTCYRARITIADSCHLCTYQWQSGETSPDITVSESGTYTLTASNVCGTASGTASVSIDHCPCDIFIPTAFSPNGDGANDRFGAYSSCSVTYYYLRVFDRWGEKVFESYDYGNMWDGTYAGRTCMPGVYVYIADIVQRNRDRTLSDKYKGSITLIR